MSGNHRKEDSDKMRDLKEKTNVLQFQGWVMITPSKTTLTWLDWEYWRNECMLYSETEAVMVEGCILVEEPNPSGNFRGELES